MLDTKFLRNHAESAKSAMRVRNYDETKVDDFLSRDAKRLEIVKKVEEMKAKQNAASKKIPQMKQNGENTDNIMAALKLLSEEISKYDKEITYFEENLQAILLNLPNIPHESVPVGKDEKDNVEVRRVGEPQKFNFEFKPHWELCKNLNIVDPETAAKITGSRFDVYKGLGAKLERALISFFLDVHTKNGYTEVLAPYIVNRSSMIGVGQLPKFEDEVFKISDSDYFLIPTAEASVTNIHKDEILDAKSLPIKYCSYSACFRAEAGSAGRDTRGLVRRHQFNKVELVKFCNPENSYDELESLVKDVENVLVLLGLPYRVVCLCTGDLGFASAKTYDIEVWMPSYERYVEISSCSNFESFQARRIMARFKNKAQDKPKFIHTLNGSGLAVGRCFAAIIENFQNEDGGIKMPEVLQKYMETDIIK